MSEIIVAKNLTKDYGSNKGVFEENFTINQGEMMGFLGTNGSGKTTTIRCLLGFIKPTYGSSSILGKDSYTHSSEILKHIGYVPGEIAFPDVGDGTTFLHLQAELLGVKDFSYANSLIEKLQLDPKANLKRMSKGMKQKTALVAALMGNPEILILDEPTTGLDPLMRESFVSIIEEEHKKGKTILMSSHMFEEVEETCDEALLINNGHLIDRVSIYDIHHPKTKRYKIEFKKKEDYLKFLQEKHQVIRRQEEFNQATVEIDKDEVGSLLDSLKNKDVRFISEITYTLEKHFLEELSKKEGSN
jgi:ABC-2 type transport system ATP-binding protein